MENDRNEQLEVLNGLILELRILLNMSVREGDSLTAKRCSEQLSALGEACRQLQNAPLPEQDKADLDVIHRIRSGSLKKCVCREYAIYNGDWFRDHPWNVPKEHEPHILAPDEFGECGTGWEEAWVSCDEKEPETYLERCAWAGKNMAFEESGFSTIDQEMQLDRYNKVGGFRIWVGDYPPSEEMRKAVAWT